MRTFGYDVDTNPIQDPPVESMAVMSANKTPNGVRVLLARDKVNAADTHLLTVTSAGFNDETSVPDSRDVLTGPVQVQGIGLTGVATLDSGDGTHSPVLRFFKQPDPVLSVGPRVSNAHFA